MSADTRPQLQYWPPSPALRGWVRQHQIVRLRFAPQAQPCVHSVKAYWPRPACALAFYPRDPEWIGQGLDAPCVRKPRAVLIGQPTVLTQRRMGLDAAVYQIEFEPGALARLLGLPLDRLTDRFADAEALMPPGFRALVDAIEDLEQAQDQVAAAEAYLLRWVSACRRPAHAADAVAAQLLRTPGARLDPLALAHGLSARQLRRQCVERLGIGPRLLARIARFDRMLRQTERWPSASWLQHALDAGYHDHQHLARDFRDFTLSTPSAFLALERAAPERQFGLCETVF